MRLDVRGLLALATPAAAATWTAVCSPNLTQFSNVLWGADALSSGSAWIRESTPATGTVWDAAAAGPGTVWAIGQRGNPNHRGGPDLHPADQQRLTLGYARLRSRPAGGYARGRMPGSRGSPIVAVWS